MPDLTISAGRDFVHRQLNGIHGYYMEPMTVDRIARLVLAMPGLTIPAGVEPMAIYAGRKMAGIAVLHCSLLADIGVVGHSIAANP